MSDTPAVSIGMPVYNAEAYLPTTIGAILAQDFGDFELIISDNASTDRSAELCEEFARQDSRIRFVRQQTNRGAAANFRYVLDAARAPIFMWAGADDWRSADSLAVTYDILATRPDVVAVNCRTRFEGDTFDRERMGDGPIEDDDPRRRVLAFFGFWHCNARYYSLFRREALLRSRTLRGEEYLASDWAVMVEMLMLGKFAQAEGGEIVLGRHGMSSKNLLRFYHRGPLDYVLPLRRFWGFTERLSRAGKFTFRQSWRLRTRVIGLNIEFAVGRYKLARKRIT
jgi:glycosyltransferase involved in cell wall biosynthesis